ncbi:hypothetical protein PAEPH01_0209 [Pancytospora epiphaga]|nr:hypothetical protein PAEPH01_0209 [Pancytospora epiphaga]
MTLIEVGITSQDRLVTVSKPEKMHKHNCKKAWARIRVQNADHTLCDDMGWSGNEVPQKALEGHRDNRFYLGIDLDNRRLYRRRWRAYPSNIDAALSVSTRLKASQFRTGACGHSSSLLGIEKV